MNTTMLAAVLYGARDLRVESCKLPELEPGQVLVKVRRAGICGSDLHYFAHGYCGSFVPSRPFILGHEFAGEVVACANDVIKPEIGTRVTVNPARPCGFCNYCKSGKGNLCQHAKMLGSASTTPPRDGAFAQFVAAYADQCIELPPQIDDSVGAMIEPLAVALHALKVAGDIAAHSVLVTGAGPIGLLIAMSARVYGAAPVAVSEIVDARRQAATFFGVDAVLNPGAETFVEAARKVAPDGFDVIFEASGTPAALGQAFGLVRRGGTIVQVGTVVTGAIPLPANDLMIRELQYIGSFRYLTEFSAAVQLIASGRLDVSPLISRVFPLNQVCAAFKFSLGKQGVLKVQIEVP